MLFKRNLTSRSVETPEESASRSDLLTERVQSLISDPVFNPHELTLDPLSQLLKSRRLRVWFNVFSFFTSCNSLCWLLFFFVPVILPRLCLNCVQRTFCYRNTSHSSLSAVPQHNPGRLLSSGACQTMIMMMMMVMTKVAIHPQGPCPPEGE